MSEIEDIAVMEYERLLQQVHLSKLDIVDSRITERLDMLEELLSVVWDLADDKYVRDAVAGVKNCVPIVYASTNRCGDRINWPQPSIIHLS